MTSKQKLAGISVVCIAVVIIIVVIATSTPKYTLSVSVSPSGAGFVSPGSGQYEKGASVTLTATPAGGYTFNYWQGDASGTFPIVTIIINSDHVLTANFIAQYDLTTYSTEGGSVSEPGEGTFTYDDGTVVDLIAEPAEGYRFVWWTGDVGTMAEATASSVAVFMNGDRVITANFAPIVSPDLPLFSPADGSEAVRITNIGFTWGSLPDANTYSWVLSENPDLSAPVETKAGLTTTAYAWTSRLDYDTRYYWRVTAWDNGVMLGESGIGTFTTTDGW